MKKTWLITDRHHFHKNIIKYECRPENFNELIIENWQDLVSDIDEIIDLGDVIFAKAGTLTEIQNQLPGYKILIKGNHDMKKSYWYKEHGFDEVHKDYFIKNKIVFSHMPVDIDKIKEETGKEIWYNIHGHFHSGVREINENTEVGDVEGRRVEDYPFYDVNRHLRLSIEEEGYKPITVEEFLKKHNKEVPFEFKTLTKINFRESDKNKNT